MHEAEAAHVAVPVAAPAVGAGVAYEGGQGGELAEAEGVKNAAVMWPVRIAVSGQTVTPGGAVEICKILGKDETIRRVKCGIEKLGG